MNNEPSIWAPGWAEKVEEAQSITAYRIGGRAFSRLLYGCESPAPLARCRDCGVSIGQRHVVHCCVERCPACLGQFISCCCGDRVLQRGAPSEVTQ